MAWAVFSSRYAASIVRLASSAASRAARDFRLVALALGDVGVDQHEAATRHWVVADFDHPSIRPGALIGSGLTRLLDEPAHMLLRVGFRPILASFRKVVDVFSECLASCDDVVGHVQDILKLAVPFNQMLRFVEHGDPVAHVLEGDAQFGLTLREFIGARAQLVQQPCAFHRDDRLGGEVLQQCDLFFREGAHLLTVNRNEADNGPLSE